MNRCKYTLFAALFASANMGTAAWAQDQTDKTKAQTNKAGAAQVAPGKENVKPGADTQAAAGVRDWGKIDKNNDKLIQPEEMESWLTQVGPQAKPKQ